MSTVFRESAGLSFDPAMQYCELGMGVLVMMPNWAAPSEAWMQRMLEGLQSNLSLVAAWNTGGASTWRGRVRAVSLSGSARLTLPGILTRLGIMHAYDFPQKILLRELRHSRIDRVLCHYGDFALRFMPVWRTVDIPLYVHFHGYDATFDLRLDDQPDRRYFPDSYLANLKELAGRAIFVANSKFTKSLLTAAGLPAERVIVKYLGVKQPKQAKVHQDREEITVLQLGRLMDTKSPDRTIMAFEMARRQGLRGNLILAGDGPMRITCELLRLRSPYQDSIHILGAVAPERAQQLLAEADILTQHNIRGEISRQEEAFGVSIVEAMAAGLPVVATRSGGVVETVVNGETGFLGEPGDIEAQAEAILRLAQDTALRQRMGEAGHQRVVQHFSAEQEAEQLREIMGLSKCVS